MHVHQSWHPPEGFDPELLYSSLAVIRIPNDPANAGAQPDPTDDFGTSFFGTKHGILFTAGHNLTEKKTSRRNDGTFEATPDPHGKALPWVWVCCYDHATRDWTKVSRVRVNPEWIDPVLDAAILKVDGASKPLSLTTDWRGHDAVVVLGFQPHPSKPNSFVVRTMDCQLPNSSDVIRYDPQSVPAEWVLRLLIRSEPLGAGMSGGPVLNLRCEGKPAIALQKFVMPAHDVLLPHEVMATALHWLRPLMAKLPKRMQPHVPLPEDRYLRALYEETAYIEIREFMVGNGRVHRPPIDALYICLTTSRPPEFNLQSGRRTTSKNGRAWHNRPTGDGDSIELAAALTHRRLLVLGDPGSGKTTFLRRITNVLCRALLHSERRVAKNQFGFGESLLPVLLRVTDLAQWLAAPPNVTALWREAPERLPEFLGHTGERWGLDKKHFARKLETGSCIVLMDGLDEAIDQNGRESAVHLIENASLMYSNCKFVVTCRPAALSEEIVLQGFVHATIDPLNIESIRQFFSNWSKTLYPTDPDGAERHSTGLVTTVESNSAMRRLARNPVMLTALAVLQWNDQHMPEQRAELYESIIRWLARSRQNGGLTTDKRVRVLQELALLMQQDPSGRQTQVPLSRAARQLSESEWVRRDGTWSSAGVDQAEWAERFLREEEIHSGIIVGRGFGLGSQVCFWHLTFQEFLAARAIVERRNEHEQTRILCGDSVLRRIDPSVVPIFRPEWRELILLLAGILYKKGQEKVDGLIAAAIEALGKNAGLARSGPVCRTSRSYRPRPGTIRLPTTVRLPCVDEFSFEHLRSRQVTIDSHTRAYRSRRGAGAGAPRRPEPRPLDFYPCGELLDGYAEY
jgi:hypothetical protein